MSVSWFDVVQTDGCSWHIYQSGGSSLFTRTCFIGSIHMFHWFYTHVSNWWLISLSSVDMFEACSCCLLLACFKQLFIDFMDMLPCAGCPLVAWTCFKPAMAVPWFYGHVSNWWLPLGFMDIFQKAAPGCSMDMFQKAVLRLQHGHVSKGCPWLHHGHVSKGCPSAAAGTRLKLIAEPWLRGHISKGCP